MNEWVWQMAMIVEIVKRKWQNEIVKKQQKEGNGRKKQNKEMVEERNGNGNGKKEMGMKKKSYIKESLSIYIKKKNK